MRITIIQRILGMLLVVYSLSLLPPLFVSFLYNDGAYLAFTVPFLIMFSLGITLWLSTQKPAEDLRLRDGFIVTVIFWVALSGVSALPFLFQHNEAEPFTVAKAVFEAVSGFTTTGATALSNIESLPKSLLYYRQQLQFLGGLGVVVVAIAVLPMLGIGGMQLYRAEAPGPMRDDKLTPRLEHTAKALLSVYLLLTLACTLAFMLAGMDFFDALVHSYTTVSTSGFSTYNDSIAHFQSNAVEIITIIFMVLGSLNFTLHYLALHKPHWYYYTDDSQSRVFLAIVAFLIIVCVYVLLSAELKNDAMRKGFWEAVLDATFHVVSIITTTGFTTEDFTQWPTFLPVLIFSSGFIGGCVGSTAGGFRVMRVILLYKQGMREVLRLIHPNAVIPLRIGKQKVSDRVAEAVWGFAFLYMASYILLSLLMLAVEPNLEPFSAFAAVAATLNMIGPGLGQVAQNFAEVSDAGLWVASFAMILGRLEIFTLLVLLTPAFWYR